MSTNAAKPEAWSAQRESDQLYHIDFTFAENVRLEG